MSEDITLERVQQLITRGPYHQWLGLKVIALHDDGIELKATWREEWVVNPDRRYTHGGVVATLVDIGADWAMVKKLGRPVPTIDLRVDYHAPAMPDLTIRGKACGRAASSRPRKRTYSTPRASPRQRPRHLFHSAAEELDATFAISAISSAATAIRQSCNHISRRRAGPREFTYRQLDAIANGVARPTRRGLARGDRVGILSANRANFWRPTSASCAPASSRCRSISGFAPDHPFHSAGCRRQARVLRPAALSRRSIGHSIGALRRRYPNDEQPGFDRFLDPGPSRRSPRAREPRCSSTRRARPARRRASCSHQSHIWVVETRLADLDRHRYLIAASIT
jgi:uncharacterized protein (TIGR00369 family)